MLLESLSAPFKQILRNAGIDTGTIMPFAKPTQGIDVNSGETVDMIEAGIVDPKKVTKSALTNAVSVAGAFLTTDAVVARN
jgi:chaperonin GroEL